MHHDMDSFGWIFLLSFFDLLLPAISHVIAIDIHNITETFKDRDAWFGTAIGPEGIEGLLVKVEPSIACSAITERPQISANHSQQNFSYNFFALIQRGNCSFTDKVFNAQKAKYDAAIVYNVGSDDLVTMTAGNSVIEQLIAIPSVFVGETAGYMLEHFYTYDTKFKPRIEIYRDHHASLDDFLVPFSAVLGATCFCLLLCLSFRYVRGNTSVSGHRLSARRLHQLPIKKYNKDEGCDLCAICLDDYIEGESLRVLPCKHAYHCQCIDPWLTRARRVCPLCKRRVLSEDNSSPDGNRRRPVPATERSHLLLNTAAASPNSSRYATGFTRRNPFRRYSTSSDSLSDTDSVVPETEEETIDRSFDRVLVPLPEPTGFSAASSFDGNLPSSPLHETEENQATNTLPLNDDVATAVIAGENKSFHKVEDVDFCTSIPETAVLNSPADEDSPQNLQEST